MEKPDESEVATQTDYFLERPITPRYCPGKIGQDACTQIEPGEVRELKYFAIILDRDKAHLSDLAHRSNAANFLHREIYFQLFDYDIEVQPILEVLVGKTIEQSLIEVLEEEEIAALKEQQRRFLELRAAEKAEEQRLAEQERRLREEKVHRSPTFYVFLNVSTRSDPPSISLLHYRR